MKPSANCPLLLSRGGRAKGPPQYGQALRDRRLRLFLTLVLQGYVAAILVFAEYGGDSVVV